MAMSRKDYEVIADALAEAMRMEYAESGEVHTEAIRMHLRVTRTLARKLHADNPRFDMEKFGQRVQAW